MTSSRGSKNYHGGRDEPPWQVAPRRGAEPSVEGDELLVIDFRYHLVSLISVFLALAIGVILGAGPLKEAIGDQLTGQVAQLRDDKQVLREQLTANQTTLVGTEAMIVQSAPAILKGTLAERRIALVDAGGATPAIVKTLSEYITKAGGEVVAQVTLTDQWTAAEAGDSRQSYASSLATYLPATATAGTYDQTLAHALALSFSGQATSIGTEFASNADLAREILISSGLITVGSAPKAPADAYIVIQTEPDATETASAAPDDSASLIARMAEVLNTDTEAAIVAGESSAAGTVIAAVRADQQVSAAVSTVSGLAGVVGQIDTPLALSSQIAGQVGAFDSAGVQTVFPQGSQLQAPNREPLVALAQAGATHQGAAAGSSPS